MSKCGRKKYIKTNLRQMETLDCQQDGGVPGSVAESESAHLQAQTDPNSAPTLAQVVAIAEADDSAESEGVTDSQKRREILSRRPSYRKILNELSSDVAGVPKIEEKSEEEGVPPHVAAMAVPTSIYQTSTGQYTATGDMPTYQIRAPATALPQGVVMAASPGSLHSPQQLAEEATRKRELRLMKNREAAKECRRRKKEYVKCLESRVAVLEVQNKKLIEELETLKDICSPKTDV
ncbi:cAMP-responsive element modulator isoform X10 [Camelus dromedarius]|uniref:cAMP-responsive element modulator n=3 Tax=Camelus TaxID=9836 RepID=A0A8B8SKS8_CAMFR|nr:cAMP-responsive element modulator isoform X14 [Camelus dromedarius]XP_032329977.1 cAMP-responsive element modulator isoform X14 [Camelus ferus]XP_045360337.1 cAMP-responsive element modulator isoform X14 [Camelus bactrianus]